MLPGGWHAEEALWPLGCVLGEPTKPIDLKSRTFLSQNFCDMRKYFTEGKVKMTFLEWSVNNLLQGRYANFHCS